MRRIQFTAYVKPEPQGSSRAFVVAGKARITSANGKLKPYRSEVAGCALQALQSEHIAAPAFPKHMPVRLSLLFTFRRPASVPKIRTMPVVKPDLDKLVRATKDALTGIVWHDDAQVVSFGDVRKVYGDVESVTVTAEME